MAERTMPDVDAMTLDEIMADIQSLSMGFGAWLGEWDDYYSGRGDAWSFMVDIYPTDDYVEWHETGEPWAHVINPSFETALRLAYPIAIGALTSWRELQAEMAAEESEAVS